jgi:hypothetical protein
MSHMKRYLNYTAIALNGVALIALGNIILWYSAFTGEGHTLGMVLFIGGLANIAWILYKVVTAFIK